MSAEEFLSLDESDGKYELIHGVVVISPSPGYPHQETLAELIGQLRPFVSKHRLGSVLSDYDLRIDPEVVYEPDLMFIRAANLRSPLGVVDFPPDIVVEILSPRTHQKDVTSKLADYERLGIPEYWIFNPRAGEMMFLRLHQGTYTEAQTPEEGLTAHSYKTALIPGFELNLDAIRAAMKVE